jgi:hypothetical protein
MFLLFLLALQLPAYVERGDAVEARYRDYAAALHDYDANLRDALTRDAPDLVELLLEKPAPPLKYGYQIVPPITPDAPAAASSPKPQSSSYSWPRTESMIDAEVFKITAARAQLPQILNVQGEERHARYKLLAETHAQLLKSQKLIESDVQYDRFWQKQIADDRPRYDRQTALYDSLIAGRPGTTTLDYAFTPPAFLKIRRSAGEQWVVAVPVYTDIADSSFLRSAKEAIERVWQAHSPALNARVEVEFRQMTPADAPAEGAHIDIESHVKRFPGDGAVLTTGANSIYAMVGRYIALGPSGIAPNVIAHEFGHILGFADGYFRGYRELGAEGFEVLEVIPNPNDIMCAPGLGHVLEDHFRLLLGNSLPN